MESSCGDSNPSSPTKTSKPSGLPRPSISGLSSRSMSRESLSSVSSYGEGWLIGDKCYVGGTKAGKVAFIGEAKFAKGEWVGVVLDGPTGKNDGSVAGVRYFQCAPNHGLFCRFDKLYRRRLAPPAANAASLNLSALNASSIRGSPDGGVNASLLTESLMNMSLCAGPTARENAAGLQVGDRVVVNGTKRGTLRFLGSVDFAEGTFAGVELISPQGKNDGSKFGHRYFECKMNYGLFAPLNKVVRDPQHMSQGSSANNRSIVPPSSAATSAMIGRATSAARLNRSRTGSQESLSSMGSARSASSRRRPGLRASPIGAGPDSPTPFSSNLNSLQDSIKEKERHIEQLLVEREMERAEMAKTSQKAEEVEQELSRISQDQSDYRMQVVALQKTVAQLEAERTKFEDAFEDEKKKTEDLNFRIEEEICYKQELEAKLEEMESQRSNTSESIENKDTSDNVNMKVRDLEELLEKTRSVEAELRQQLLETKTESESKIQQLESSLGSLKAQLDMVNDSVQTKDRSVCQTEATIQELKQLNFALTSENALLKSELECVSLTLKKTKTEADISSQQQISSSTALKEARELIEKLKADIDLAKTTASASESALRHSLDDQSKELAISRNAVVSLEKKLAEESGSIEEQTMLLQDKSKKILELEEALSNRDLDLNAYKEDLEARTGQLSQFKMASETKVKSLEEHLHESKNLVSGLEEQLSALQLLFEEKSKELVDVCKQRNIYLNDRELSKAELAVLQSKHESEAAAWIAEREKLLEIQNSSELSYATLLEEKESIAATLQITIEKLESRVGLETVVKEKESQILSTTKALEQAQLSIEALKEEMSALSVEKESELSALQKKISLLSETNSDIQRKFDTKVAEMIATEAESSRLTNELTGKLEHSLSENNDLVASKALLSDSVQQLEIKLAQNSGASNEQVQMLNEKTNALAEVQKESADQKNKLFEFEMLLNDAKSQVASLETTLADKTKVFNDVLAGKESEIENLSSIGLLNNDSIAKLDLSVKDLNCRLEQSQAQLVSVTSEFEAKLNSKQLEIEHLTTDLLAKSETVSNIEKNLVESATEQKSKEENLTLELKEKTFTIEQLQAGLSESSKMIAEKDSTLNDQAYKLEELTGKFTRVAQELESRSSDLMNRDSSIVQLTADIENVKSELLAVKTSQSSDSEANMNELNSLKLQINDLRTVNLKLEEDLVSSRATFAAKISEEAELSGSVSALKQDLVARTAGLDAADALINQIKIENEMLKQEIIDLHQSHAQSSDEIIQRLSQENDKLKSEVCDLGTGHTKLEAELKLRESALSTLRDAVAKAHVDVDLVQTKAAESVTAFEDKIATLQAEALEANQKCVEQNLELQQKLDSNQGHLNELQEIISQLKLELSRRIIEEDFNKIQQENASLKQMLEEISSREASSLAAYQNDRSRLLEQLAEATSSQPVKLRNKNLNQVITQDIRPISLVENFELEKFEMQEKILELEARLQECSPHAAPNSNGGAASVDHINGDIQSGCTGCEEHSSCPQQMDFLNSVIVDLQKKMQVLQHQKEVLEMTSVSELIPEEEPLLAKTRAPRLYCDFCDRFDAHDTEECPSQEAMDVYVHSKNKGRRKSKREFCDNCDMFGHATEDCKGGSDMF